MTRQVNQLPDETREWVVSGDSGAVNFLVFPKTGITIPVIIGIHGLQRFGRDQERGECDILPGGKCYCSKYQAEAETLWAGCGQGRYQKVIWRTLERMYALTWKEVP